MQSINIVFTALAIAFCWVEFVNPFTKTKPFNCIKCMTGWVGLIIGCYFYNLFGLIYLPIGVFAGAIFEAIKMRWL